MAEIIEPTSFLGKKVAQTCYLATSWAKSKKKNDVTICCLEWVALALERNSSWFLPPILDIWAVSQFSHVTTKKTHWGMNFQSKPCKFESYNSYSIHMESIVTIVWWIFDSPTASKAPDNFWPYLCIDPDKSLRVSTICTHRHWLQGYTVTPTMLSMSTGFKCCNFFHSSVG